MLLIAVERPTADRLMQLENIWLCIHIFMISYKVIFASLNHFCYIKISSAAPGGILWLLIKTTHQRYQRDALWGLHLGYYHSDKVQIGHSALWIVGKMRAAPHFCIF